MYISVEGFRTDPSVWDAVRGLPADQLPPLTLAQKEVATKLGIPQDEYARSALAAQRTAEMLLKKAEWFARAFERLIKDKGSPATIERVTLDTWASVFLVKLHLSEVPIRVDETVVDDLFERGSEDAEKRLSRIVDLALAVGAL